MTCIRSRTITTLFALTMGATPAFAVGPPIQLASPPFTGFTGRSLVVADLDGANGTDLVGVDASGIVISLRNPGGSFAPQQSIAMAASKVKVADLDGDGRLDLVTASSPGFTTRRSLGGMSFAPAELAATSASAGPQTSLALGDLNGDGRPDAVASLFGSSKISIALNDGAGHLQTPFDLSVATGTLYVAIGDYTHDGKIDVAGVTYACGGPPGCCTVTVFPGHGDGTFDAGRVTTYTNIGYRLSIAGGDLDGDGDLDLVLFKSDGLAWLPNHGDGTFAPPVSVGMPYSNGSIADGQIAVGDLDHDGHPDIVVPAYLNGGWQQRNFFSVLLNRGDGTFYPPTHHHVGYGPLDAALADLDGDGWLDGIVTTTSSQELSPTGPATGPVAYVLRNSHYGTFDAHIEVLDNVWMPVRRPVGPADLVGSAGGRLTRSRNRGHGTFLAMEDLGGGTPWRAADLDGDGDDDLIVTSGDSLWVRHALGGGAYGPPSSIQKGLTPRVVADVTGDGRLDLVAIDAALHVQVLAGDGVGGLGPPSDAGLVLAQLPADGGMAAADVNGDGERDLLDFPLSGVQVSTFPTWVVANTLFVSLNDGTGHFGAPASFPVQQTVPTGTYVGTSMILVEDFDGDHVPDVLLMGSGCGNDSRSWWAMWHGLGGGAFTTVNTALTTGNSACSVAAADLNGDGLADFVRSNGNGGLTMSVNSFTSNGDGSFATTGSGAMQELPTSVVLADMDGDGKLDVVTRSLRTNNASIRRNVTQFDLPTPTLVSLVSADLVEGAAVLDWYAAGDAPTAASIERRTDASGWSLLAPLPASGDGHLHYVDATLPTAPRVGYRLRWSDSDGAHVTAESWVDLPSSEFGLSGTWPNPARSMPAFAMELPRAGAIEVDVFDVGGRRVAHERTATLAAGRQRVTLPATLGPGVYIARVAFAGRRLETRFVVLQ